MKGQLHLLVGQALEHETHHAQIDPGLAGSRQEEVVVPSSASPWWYLLARSSRLPELVTENRSPCRYGEIVAQ